MAKSRTEDWLDVLDIGDSTGEKELYQFDKNKMLRFYAFVIDDSNGYDYSIRYDSLGNIVNKTGPEIVRWYLFNHGNDSLTISFLLNAIHYSYGKVSLTLGNDSFKNVLLFKSVYSNLIGHDLRVKNFIPNDDSNKKMLYISGIKVNRCTLDTSIFKDSVYLPNVPKKAT
jgi:hypothetical protein